MPGETGCQPGCEGHVWTEGLSIALADPDGLAYRHLKDHNYDSRFRRRLGGPHEPTVELLLKWGATPYTRNGRNIKVFSFQRFRLIDMPSRMGMMLEKNSGFSKISRLYSRMPRVFSSGWPSTT